MSTPSFALPYISGAQSLKTTLLRISCHPSSDLVSTSDGHLPGMWKTGRKQKLLFCWQQLMNTWAVADSKFCSVLWHTNTIFCLGFLCAYDHWQQYPAVPTLGISNKVLIIWKLEANLTATGSAPCPCSFSLQWLRKHLITCIKSLSAWHTYHGPSYILVISCYILLLHILLPPLLL